MWPLILALAGTGLQMAGAQKAQKASKNALYAELERQRVLREQAQALAQANVQKSTPEGAETARRAGIQQHLQGYRQAADVPLMSSTAAAPMNRSSSAQSSQRLNTEMDKSNQQRAGLMGYSEWELQKAIQNLLTNQQLGVVGNFAAGSNRILPMELEAASHAGDSLAGIGSLLGTAGSVLGMSGALNGLSSPLVDQRALTYTTTGAPMVPALGSGQSLWGNAVMAAPPKPYFNFLTGK